MLLLFFELLNHGSNFGSEVVNLLFNAFALFKTSKSNDLYVLANRCDVLSNSYRGILNERLVEQADFFCELSHSAFNDLFENVFGLGLLGFSVFLLNKGKLNFLFSVDYGSGNVSLGNILRSACGNLEKKILSESLNCVVLAVIGFKLDDRTDNGTAAVVNVFINVACHSYEAADLDIFTDSSNSFGKNIADLFGFARGNDFLKVVDACYVVFEDSIGNQLNKFNKSVGLCCEVGFNVDFNGNADLLSLIYLCIYKSFSGNSAGLLSCLCKTLFAKILYSGVNIAVCLLKRSLAVHHTAVCEFL